MKYAITDIRRTTYKLLEPGQDSSAAGRAVDIFLIVLITVNVIAVMLETVPALHERYETFFYRLEVFSVLVFTIEYILRIWSCVEADPDRTDYMRYRIKFATSPMAIIDLLAILPSYLTYFFNVDLRILRILRLLRIFKLTRYSAAMTTLLTVLREEKSNFTAAVVIMLVIMIIAASGMYYVENEHQPENFGSIPQSMWWAIVTLTTVGYGDVVPTTIPGRFLAALIMIAGVGLVALPTGILASSFSENLKHRRDELSFRVDQALEDGVIDHDEEADLLKLSQELGIPRKTLAQIMKFQKQQMRAPTSDATSHCPHCGKEL